MSRLIAAAAAVMLGIAPASAQPERPKEELVDRVKASIDRGVRYIRQQQDRNGSFERGGVVGFGSYVGGQSSLCLLALLYAGVPPGDEVVQAGLRFIRGIEPQSTYVLGLQTMVLAEVDSPQDKIRIQRNVDLLLRAVRPGFHGWDYGFEQALGPDFSNTQYALLGLHAGKQAGARIPNEAWRHILDLYKNSQLPDGSWGYKVGDRMSRLTMTTAGLCGLHIAGLELRQGRQQLDRDTGVAARCGEYDEDPKLRKSHEWLARPGNFSFEIGQAIYYSVYGVERAGRMSGLRFLAERDWYRDGCLFLVSRQQDNGSWNGGLLDGGTIGSTAFAILFLSKGRTPTLISKLAWGENEWNNKHHDVKHIADYASRELFKKEPLAWQIYDCRKSPPNRVLTDVADLLQSPIVYLNGHEAPRLSGVQKEILKRYVQEGGFVFAEACCGSNDFTRGFRELMKEMFEKDMVPVAADHAIYRAHAVIRPDDAAQFPLERLDLGCKTVVILATRPLAGWWEENLHAEGKGQLAFRLAGNIVAYATNMELPKPKLTQVKIADEKLTIRLPRNYLKIAQIRHEGDWEPAPQAMRNLMLHLRTQYRIDVALEKEAVSATSPNLFQYRFLYMHGRRAFNFADSDLKNLRANLKTGGLLLADACCGSPEFDKSFRTMANNLFADAKLESIPDDDPLYSAELNGRRIERVKCRRPRAGGERVELQEMRPELEGVRLNGRWVVIYSKYDLGCALEKHPSSDCIGHDHESALSLAGAAVLYYLRN